MIKYEDYNLPCPLQATDSSQEPLAFIRSEFEYATRQRRTFKGYTQSNFSIILKHFELAQFDAFWEAINYGADSFNADFFLHGKDTVNKVVRFTNSYKMQNLGSQLFKLTIPIEVLSFGDPYGACPLYPSETLYPSNTLYPCE